MAQAPQDEIKVVSWNVRGLGTRIKKGHVKDLRKGEDKNIDIMCLVETFANSDAKYDTAFKDNNDYMYTVIAKSTGKLAESPRGRFPGGLLLAYKPELPYTFARILNLSDFILWVRADPHKPDVNVQMIFAVVYYPPSDKTTKDEIITIMKREYETLADTYKGAVFYIMGDFNADTLKLADYPDDTPFKAREFTDIKTASIKEYVKHGECLLDFCKNSGFRIANGRFGDQSTGITTKGNVLDYMLCREKDWMYVKSFKVKDDLHGSDHRPLIFSINTKLPMCWFSILGMKKLMESQATPFIKAGKLHVIFGIEDENQCTDFQLPGYKLMEPGQNSHVHVYINENSPYIVQDLDDELKLKQKSVMIPVQAHVHTCTCTLAPVSAPLFFTDIHYLYLNYSFSKKNTLAMVQTLKSVWNACFPLYPKSRLIFSGYLFNATPQKDLIKHVENTIEEFQCNLSGNHQMNHMLKGHNMYIHVEVSMYIRMHVPKKSKVPDIWTILANLPASLKHLACASPASKPIQTLTHRP